MGAALSVTERARRVQAARAATPAGPAIGLIIAALPEDDDVAPDRRRGAGTDNPPLQPDSRAGSAMGPAPPAQEGVLPRVIRDGVPVDRWALTADGLVRWRPIVDRLAVTALPDGGRLLAIGGRFELRLSREEAAHLARLLNREEDRCTG